MKRHLRCCDYALIITAIALAILGIVGLVTFPSMYKGIVYSNLMLSRNHEDDSLGFSALLYSKPPMINVMNFYFFNITNAEEMVYERAKPRVVEIGPFAFMESENKRYLQFTDDDSQLFYQNYKTWHFNRSLSCSTCEYSDTLAIPNAPQLGASAGMLDPRYGIDGFGRFLIGLVLVLVGEKPINNPSVGDLLFDGYNDALLSIAHSTLFTVLSTVFNHGESLIPIPIPDMKTFAFFNGYNNSRDEQYWVRTGQEDIDRLGQIVSWADRELLPEDWWTTTEARMINGTDTGSFSNPGLTRDSVIPMFHSYLCRSFAARYVGQRDVEGIPSYTYSVLEDNWDTTLPENKGFRYRNFEKKNYFSEWPKCPRHNSSNCRARPLEAIDCASAENICDDCCYKGQVEGTYIMPPGMFPLVCYPGRLQPSPFAVLWSPPHFLYSPKEVTSSVVGISPKKGQHDPMVYDHEPYSGMITRVAYRVQISMPLFANKDVISNSHLPDAVVPMFYEDSQARKIIWYKKISKKSKITAMHLKEFAYDYFRLGFVLAPKLATGVFIAFIVLAIIFIAAFGIKYFRKEKQQ